MTNSSQVAVALIINAVSYVLTNWLGVTIDNAAITTTVETLVVVGTAIWALVAHRKVVSTATTAGVKGI